MRSLLIVSLLAACGGKPATPAPKAPEPVAMDDQAQCQRIAERTVDRFMTAAVAKWDHPEKTKPTVAQALAGEQRDMFVTVVFDSCFAEWPQPARACFLDGPADAPIESCRALDAALRAKAIERTLTVLYSLST